ncbi:hypothetical protein FAM09_21600 [Niastella caeni]|uniref:Bulb-type lectin domain-containing protein n=1 Tax=Niastella caeni TaxID=2569763 RepID=A0A4V4H0C3_9BACT|nr:M57 family metalloprotease [Niastella caeni]THU35986.1 hypothetical protein FAM09_21600 [Niastella caeni]
MISTNQLRYVIYFLLITAVWGCAKDKTAITEQMTHAINEDHPVFQQMIKAGFDKKNIVEYADRFVAEEDIIFYKKEPIAAGEHMTEQARTPYLVSASYNNVTVFLNTASFGSIGTNLSNALNAAIASYNAIGTGIAFTRVASASGALIQIVRNNGIGANVCGQAGFPFSNGQPFNIININESFLVSSGYSSQSQLTLLLAHEMGHCIGLRHTNWQVLGEGFAPTIGATPLTDASSAMNGATCGAFWAGLSANDITALRILYSSTNLGAVLNSNAVMYTNQYLKSTDGRFMLILQTDGNLVLYFYNTFLWHTNTVNPAVNRLNMQGDGNLVLYDSYSTPYFNTGTSAYPGAYVVLQNDGNLVIYQGGVFRWQSGTCCH